MATKFTSKTSSRYATVCCTLFASMILLTAQGCKKSEEIVTHKIPKTRSGLESLRTNVSNTASTAPTVATPAVETRMVVGFYALESSTWFFKITGPVDQVKEAEPQWKAFLDSLSFKDGQPIYELPEGWAKGGDRPMRFATLTIGETDPSLEMAISKLGAGQDLLLNVNRWRGQLGLANIAKAELESDMKEIEFADGKAWLFDATGKFSGGMSAPFANRAKPPAKKTPPPAEAPTSFSDVKYDTPDGWEMGPTSPMVPVRLKRNIGDDPVQMTIIPMPAAVNEWAPNATRWAGQAGLSLSAEELKTKTKTIEVDGVAGDFLTLVNEADGNGQALIAGMVKRNGTAWFLKLSGKNAAVEKSQEDFDKFLKSIKFPAN